MDTLIVYVWAIIYLNLKYLRKLNILQSGKSDRPVYSFHAIVQYYFNNALYKAVFQWFRAVSSIYADA